MDWLLWLSLALVAYTYAGFPIVLWVLAKVRSRPIRKTADTPDVVMIVVAHNEAYRIRNKLATCLAQQYPADRLSVLVVSDGSSDDTDAIVADYGDPRVALVKGAGRRGKAACLNDGVKASRAPIIVFTDARQRLHPQAVARLVANFGDPTVGAVSGELVFEQDDGSPFAQGIGAYWLYEKFIRNNEALSGSVIGVTGALYAIRRECYEPIPSETILDDVAIPMAAAVKGWRIGFETGAIAYDHPSTDAAQEKIRKVRTLAGNFQLVAMYRHLMSPLSNPLWWRFVSHKLLRLLGPFALLTAFAAHSVLAFQQGGLYMVSWWAHLAAYVLTGLALQFPVLQRAMPVKLAVTFAHLNIFVIQGMMSFMRTQQSHLWERSSSPVNKK